MEDNSKKSKELVEESWDLSSPIIGEPTSDDLNKAVSLLQKSIKLDERNILAYDSLSRIYLENFNDSQKAEEYCKKGLSIKDVPSSIKKVSPGFNNAVEESEDDFNNLMMLIKLKQGNQAEANTYLEKMKSYFEKHGKGNFHLAKNTFDEYTPVREAPQRSNATTTQSSSKGWLIVLIIIVIIIIFLSM